MVLIFVKIGRFLVGPHILLSQKSAVYIGASFAKITKSGDDPWKQKRKESCSVIKRVVNYVLGLRLNFYPISYWHMEDQLDHQ